ncbi:MAG: DUF4080 domain-containing protein [Kiritimatiellae bacterium]|nr:DUF4080 domain-containing protein [Kiritimatiellia bacterium]
MSLASDRIPTSADILLVAVNARYSHCSYAGRTLMANLGPLTERAALLETDLDTAPMQLASAIAARAPRIAGFSVYLWNTRLVRDTAQLLRSVAPGMAIVCGGPEIVAGCAPDWRGLADALVRGEGEQVFREWCLKRLRCPPGGETAPGEPEWIEVRDGVAPETLDLPYGLYSDADIRQRTIYVESSRGCPFHCLYCSSCGSGLRLLPLARLLPELERLRARGVRRFKFLDRSINADEAHACALLDFFLERPATGLHVHFELTPVKLGDDLRARLAAFAPGVLHLEVGVQTLSDAVARRIGRPETRVAALECLRFLTRETGACVHADLIFGLPGEDQAGFAAGFDTLVRMGLPELQVNRLKGLPGTPLLRLPELSEAFSPLPPYEVLRTDALDFAALTRLQRFATAWDRLNNRGHFRNALPLLWRDPRASPYAAVAALAERVQTREGRVHALGEHAWARHLYAFLLESQGMDDRTVRATLAADGVPDAVLRAGG